MRWLVAIFAVMSCAASVAAPPVITILGPTGGVPGDILLLDASKTDAKFFAWRVTPKLSGDRPTIVPVEDGKKCLVASVPGTYHVFLSASNEDGLDVAEWVVTVSGNPTPPTPPNPPPGPDLKGFAKQVYDAAAGLDKATVTQAAGAYGAQVSAINAGAYNSLGIEVAKQQIANTIAEANPPRQSAQALFNLIDGELQRREESGQFASLAAISAALAEITAGLEARAR